MRPTLRCTIGRCTVVCLSIGRTYVMVLPLPVGALAMRSKPRNAAPDQRCKPTPLRGWGLVAAAHPSSGVGPTPWVTSLEYSSGQRKTLNVALVLRHPPSRHLATSATASSCGLAGIIFAPPAGGAGSTSARLPGQRGDFWATCARQDLITALGVTSGRLVQGRT